MLAIKPVFMLGMICMLGIKLAFMLEMSGMLEIKLQKQDTKQEVVARWVDASAAQIDVEHARSFRA